MAGIGFELRRILLKDSYTSTLRAYIYAGLISSGPWVLSIISVMLIGIVSLGGITPEDQVRQFLVSVTYLMAVSLILTGGLQLYFTRFISDRLYQHKGDIILPNLLGILGLVTVFTGFTGAALVLLLFDQSLLFCVLLVTNLVVLCNLWMVIIFLSGMKAYNRILLTMLVGYAVMIGSGFVLRDYNLEGLLLALLIGHASLVFMFLYEILREYPAERLVSFDFLDRRQVFLSLLFTGFAYNAGVWVDKFIFWFNPATSQEVIGPLRMSLIYDLPIFLAYLAVIPGMAVFLVRIETDFAEAYERLYNAIRGGETLGHIYYLKDQMLLTIRQGLFEILKEHGITIVLQFPRDAGIRARPGISPHYLPLFYVNLVGVSIQVLLMALLNVFFYLDKRRIVLELTVLFLLLNALLTMLSQALGPSFFGYGFAVSLLITALTGLLQLSRSLDTLEYETFMLGR